MEQRNSNEEAATKESLGEANLCNELDESLHEMDLNLGKKSNIVESANIPTDKEEETSNHIIHNELDDSVHEIDLNLDHDRANSTQEEIEEEEQDLGHDSSNHIIHNELDDSVHEIDLNLDHDRANSTQEEIEEEEQDLGQESSNHIIHNELDDSIHELDLVEDCSEKEEEIVNEVECIDSELDLSRLEVNIEAEPSTKTRTSKLPKVNIAKTLAKEQKTDDKIVSLTSSNNEAATSSKTKQNSRALKASELHFITGSKDITSPTKTEDVNEVSDLASQLVFMTKSASSKTAVSDTSRVRTNPSEIKPKEMTNSNNKTKSPIKHIIAIFACSVIAVLIIVVKLRVALRIFCTYDDNMHTYIVMKKVEQCPVLLEQSDDEKCPFWKRCDEIGDLISYVPAPAGKKREKICRGSFNVLHAISTLMHPSLDYKNTMPRVRVDSPCPDLPEPKKKKLNIFQKLFRKKEKKEISESTSSDELDWTLFVSSPFELDLSPKEKKLAEKVTANLQTTLAQKYQKVETDRDWLEKKMDSVAYGGGKAPWWLPAKDNFGKDKEAKGLRQVASYMKIMHWPEDLRTKFPFSGICSDGCDADFALANTIEWREKYMPWSITQATYNENKDGFVYVRGYSPTRYHSDPAVGGSSILWLRPGVKKIDNTEAFSRAIINALENCIADAYNRSGGYMGKCNVVLDCDDVGLSKIPPIVPTKLVLKNMQDNYPDKLGTFVITNLSGAAQMFLNLVLPLLPDVVRQKIHIIPNDEEKRMNMMKELVHEDFIPKRLGGKDNYVFDAKQYYQVSQYRSEIITDEAGVEYYETMPYYGP